MVYGSCFSSVAQNKKFKDWAIRITLKTGVTSSVPEGWVDPVSHSACVVLHFTLYKTVYKKNC